MRLLRSKASNFHAGKPSAGQSRLFLFACLAGFLPTLPANAIVFDAAADFSISNGNPNGVWQYGYSTVLGGSLIPYTMTTPAAYPPYGPTTYQAWVSGIAPFGAEPLMMKNVSPNAEIFGDISLEAGQLSFHPGPDNEYSVIRWTAPRSGQYAIDVFFEGRSTQGTTTDVHMLTQSNVVLQSAIIDGFLDSANFQFNLTFGNGDILDFAVGMGFNGDFHSDTTGIGVVITSVAEPGILALLSFGLAGVGTVRRLRSKP